MANWLGDRLITTFGGWATDQKKKKKIKGLSFLGLFVALIKGKCKFLLNNN